MLREKFNLDNSSVKLSSEVILDYAKLTIEKLATIWPGPFHMKGT